MNNTQQLKKCLNTIIELWDEYVSEPVIQMIYDFAREPICGDGNNIPLVNGCKKKSRCVTTTLKIGHVIINKWYCDKCSLKLVNKLKE